METGLTKIVLEGRIAIFMEANVTIGTIEEGVILFKMRAETSPTRGLKNSLNILP